MLITKPVREAAAAEPACDRDDLFGALSHVTGDLSLSGVQRRIVAAACGLVGAADGALAIRGRDGEIIDVVSRGAGFDLVSRACDPSCGCAPHRDHVVVQLLVRGTVYATLHVAPDMPAGAATRLLQQFAEAASAAVDSARHYDEARRSSDWLSAAGEIARALLADADADTLLDVVTQALYVAEADLASLILPTGDGRLRVAISIGVGASGWQGKVFEPSHSAAGRAIACGESVLVSDLMPLTSDEFVNVHGYGPAMLAPLIDAKGIRGAVVLVRLAGRPGFTPHELALATTFADQVALALELNDMRADGEALRALQDRHRIAQELHDNVMQRLFATGVGLQGLTAKPAVPVDVAERLRQHVADLDETIDEIRGAVFGLRTGVPSDIVRTPARFPRTPAEGRPRPRRARE